MKITPFLFENSALVRSIEREGEPWFVAKDVCEALGKVWKGAEALEVIPEHWKGVRKLGTPSGDQELWIINEAALYKLAFRSNKDTAQRFTDWIKQRVEQYDFAENRDFVIASENSEANGRGGQNRKDYFLTLDMAKELSICAQPSSTSRN